MCRKWRVISHPLNTNPFPGSFLNCRGRLRLRDVSINNLTLVELDGGFDTEHTVSIFVISINPLPSTAIADHAIYLADVA